MNAGPVRRLRECVEQWPEAESGEYNPKCCRFPKSCSATIYDPEQVTDDQLEPAPAPRPAPPAPPTGLGEIAYRAYYAAAFGAEDGQQPRPWADLSDDVRGRWVAAAHAVVDSLTIVVPGRSALPGR